MKNIFFIICLIVAFRTVNSQPIRGDRIIGLGGNAAYRNIYINGEKLSYSNIIINPSYSKFIMKHLELGVSSILYAENRRENKNNYHKEIYLSGTVFIRRQDVLYKKTYLRSSIYSGYAKYIIGKNILSFADINISLGLSYWVNRNIGLFIDGNVNVWKHIKFLHINSSQFAYYLWPNQFSKLNFINDTHVKIGVNYILPQKEKKTPKE